MLFRSQEHHQDDRQAARDPQLLRDPGERTQVLPYNKELDQVARSVVANLLICAIFVYFLFICDGTEEHVLNVDMSLLN